ncbi:MAG TPA: hypothetical protein VLT16_18635 [Candidatus Limnocylindrales bacterium]|nr:hypothetical protein [Candidatus Limnocylindrales bacterium]
MKSTLGAILILCLGLSAAAQTRATGRVDLESTLLDLERTAASTNSDIGHLRIGTWKGGWKSGFTVSGSHKQRAEQAAGSLQRNLRSALPELIRDTLNSHGTIATTFKVFEDVSLVCETLDSLVETAQQVGKKDEYLPLTDDYSNLMRIRRTLSAYIQQRAAALEPGSQSSYPSSYIVPGSNGARKIIIDDTEPAKKQAKKKPRIQYTNNY